MGARISDSILSIASSSGIFSSGVTWMVMVCWRSLWLMVCGPLTTETSATEPSVTRRPSGAAMGICSSRWGGGAELGKARPPGQDRPALAEAFAAELDQPLEIGPGQLDVDVAPFAAAAAEDAGLL